MEYYFISTTPYHLKINGEYVGKVTKNLTSLNLSHDSFLEFLPLSSDLQPIYTDLKCCLNVKKYPFLSGEIILPIFNKNQNCIFKVLGQKQFSVNGYNFLLTLLIDGYVKFYVDGSVSIIDCLPFIPSDFEVYSYNSYVFFVFTSNKTILIGYDFSTNTPTLIFKDLVDKFEISNPLKIEKSYQFINPIIVFEEWNLSSKLTLLSRKTTLQKHVNEIHYSLIPLSFMQTLSVMGDVSIYLTDELKQRQNDLYEFIKKPKLLFTSPNSFNEIISITETDIFTYKIETTNNLISNIIEK